MGMAASQARYLALTARKTNVEFAGQQINQQRTLLGTESAGLFNEILEINAPTPPIVENYYNTTYTITQDGTKYSILDKTMTKNADGTYTMKATYNAQGDKAESTGTHTGRINGMQLIEDQNTYTLVEISPSDLSASQLAALKSVNKYYNDKDSIYTYEVNGQTEYLSQYEYSRLSSGGQGDTYDYVSYLIDPQGEITETGTITGTLTKSSTTNRYDKLSMTSTDIEALKPYSGATFALGYTTEQDEQAYEQAMLDYEYAKALYTKRIEEINAKAENIQIQDRTLELKLRQLDTEQNSIQTELESVKKVIEDTVKNVFTTYQGS